MVPEAPLEQTEDGFLPAGEGWFVLNAREAAWRTWEGMGKWPPLEGSKQCIDGTADWGAYTVDDAALRHGTGVEEETTDGGVAYGRFPEPVSTRYRDGWLPG